jgi:CheY-like chemotaxis protein
MKERNCNYKDHKMIGTNWTSTEGTDSVMDQRPRLLLVYADSVNAVRCSRFFRRHGWDVHMAASGEEALDLIDPLAPAAVVLDAELPNESAWEISSQITKEYPRLNVVLVAEDGSVANARPANGAALVARRAGMEGLAEQLLGVAVA